MLDYTHRDRRAQRSVSRAFLAMGGIIVGLIVFALGMPFDLAGLLGVVALGGLGIAYLGWSDRLLRAYTDDLRTGLEGGGASGLLGVELRTPVGLDRAIGRPTARSPHVRRRAPAASGNPEDARRGAGHDVR